MPKNKVFIVEDDKTALLSLRKLLEASGFETESTFESKEALMKIKLFKPDIILLDLLMPEIGGLEICEILNKDNSTRGIPVIVISALKNPADIKKSYELGVVGYFTKPYDYPELEKKIRKFIEYKIN